MSQLLPYETIVKASEGDPEAVAAVLSHYAGYIRSCAKMDGQIIDLFIEIAAFFDVTLDHLIMGKSLSDQEESLRNKLQQKRLTNQKLRLKLQRIMQKLSAIAEEL